MLSFRTILMATLIFVILFAVEELMVIRQFSPLSYLDAPIQSISCLAGKHITISIAHWYLSDAVTSSSKYNDLCSRDL